MEEGLGIAMDDVGKRGDVIDRARLVIDRHDGDEDDLVIHDRFQRRGFDRARFVDGQDDEFEAEFVLQLLKGVFDGGVFDRGGDDLLAAVLIRKSHAFDGEVVGFGRAREEDALLGRGVQAKAIENP